MRKKRIGEYLVWLQFAFSIENKKVDMYTSAAALSRIDRPDAATTATIPNSLFSFAGED